ncbi:hypothetical protein GPECTOR_23g31 [Gonium pectorale]|uniref:UvrD-like helicase ATP-binding domain-containing protein n=1 Tax=Gonium pectorale TaxID=33097 RepID=A0A150GIA3_GONPE|nr:hypothetical protein GPECTOR_23g31 [Gonium pectorale]|eukprot:KXZ49100.1 hypothetical protein GPECTOR_23g31 [Gonium pectorale]
MDDILNSSVAVQRAKKVLQLLEQKKKVRQQLGAAGAAADAAVAGAAAQAAEAESSATAGAGKRKADGGKGAAAAAAAAEAPAVKLLRTVADLADDEAVRSQGIAQLVAVPETVVLPLAAKLAKLLPAGCLRGAAASGGADGEAAADSEPANAATNRELQRIVGEMRVEDGADEELDPAVADADAEAANYSDDDAPPPGEAIVEAEDLLRQQDSQSLVQSSQAQGPGQGPAQLVGGPEADAGAGPAGVSEADHPLRGLAWRFVITRQAYEAWGRLPDQWRRLVMDRLRVIGSGYWARCRGAKKLTADDPLFGQQELWRLKITKAGRILFEVAVEYDEESRTWAEMIRLWFITLNHKAYEDMIGLVRQSFRRTLAMRERLRLQPLPHCEVPVSAAAATAAAAAAAAKGGGVSGAAGAAGRAVQRLPRHYREAGTTAAGDDGDGGAKTRGSAQKAAEKQQQLADLREHFPPASWAADTYTLMKFYSLDTTLVSAVLQGLEAAKVDFPFKLSPQEYDLITLTPSPPSSIILLGRSGTGKTTCAVYRLWGNWLRHHTNPGLDPVHAIFVTASATLRERVARAFRRLQSAVLPEEQYARVVALSNATYHTFRDVPSEAFPLFLSSRACLRMLDGTTARPFFPRVPNGAILQLPDDGEEVDPDGAALVVALDEDASDDEEDEAEGDGAADGADGGAGEVALEEEQQAAAAAEAEATARAAALQELEGGAGAEGEVYGLGVAGRARLNREVTYQYFVSSMWKHITTPEQRTAVAPGLVYQEIMSYLKGSAEAIASPVGHISLDEYLRLGRKRAANFSEELRRDLVYERLKRHESRYDLLDVVGHVYRELTVGGYNGTPVHALYRDEVQDFTQAELLLDLAVAADPNCLFYCGDTAQTIARGIGFRFEDIRTLFWEENQRRQQAAAAAAMAAAAAEGAPVVLRKGRGMAVATPPIYQLTMNYRTHQGVLDVAALVVDVLRRYFPRQLDRLEREQALFPGPHPLLLGGISADDLAILLSGSDKNTSQVEFGAHQVILVFIVDFFADSDANAEWRVLSSYLQELREAGGVTPPDPGAVRTLEFDDRAHVLLAEELKHLYTALTRAKNNVVIFDRNPAKRAPFYHLLQSLGIARTVHKSLLEDGRDAVRYGLTQQATSSRAEWAKRARNLMENHNYAMAKKAFIQATDPVRAEVADAYLKRQRAREEESLPERRRLLGAAALQLLAAASRRADSPDPVSPAELRRWTLLAGRFLQACGNSAAAAELYFKTGNHRLALRMLLDGKEHRAAADCCLDAAAEALSQHDAAARAAAAEAAEAAACGLLPLPSRPGGGGIGDVMGADGVAGSHAVAAAEARKRALLWLVKGVEQVFLANELELLVALLAPPTLVADMARRRQARAGTRGGPGDGGASDDELWVEEQEMLAREGATRSAAEAAAAARFAPLALDLHEELRRRWVGNYGRALRQVALRCHMRGEHMGAVAAMRLMPVEAERDALLERLGYWRELARLKRTRDPLGAAQLLLDNGDTGRAARLVSEHIAGKAPKQPGGAWAPVDERAWQVLHRCIATQADAEGARRLRRQLDRWAPSIEPVAAPAEKDKGKKDKEGGAAAAKAAPAGASGTGTAERMLLYRGHSLLLEARLLLQSWVAAGRGSGKDAPVPTQPAPVPESWEAAAAPSSSSSAPVGASGGAASVDASRPSAAGSNSWQEAAPVLSEAAECFKRTGFWPGYLEALTLLLQFGPEDGSAVVAALGKPDPRPDAAAAPPGQSAPSCASATAAAAPVGGVFSAAAAAAAAAEAAMRPLDRALALLRAAQTAADALNASRLTELQQKQLALLEQHYGLPGLASRGGDWLPAKQATHVWWASLGPEKAAEARRAAAGGPAAPGKATGKPLSYAAAAAKAAATGLPGAAAAASQQELPPLVPSRTLLRQHLAALSLQAVLPDAAGLLPRPMAVAQLVRDLVAKAACVAHAAAVSALERYLRGCGAGPAAAGAPLSAEAALRSLRPVVRAARLTTLASVLLRGAEKQDPPAAPLQRSLAALLRRAFAAVATAPLAPAQSYSLQQELQQPPTYHVKKLQTSHGGLVELLVSEGLAKPDLHAWVSEQVVHAQHLGPSRLAMAPPASYVALRTLMLVLLHDEKAKKVYDLRRGSLQRGVPAARMLRVAERTAVPEYVLLQAFNMFKMGVPHRALGELLYYLAWCARRDGILEAVVASASPSAVVATPAAAAAPESTPSPAGWVLPLEAYLEVTEVVVGQLVVAACENAFLAASVAGTLVGMPFVSDPHKDGLAAVAAAWNKLLGFDPPTRPAVPGGGRMGGGPGGGSAYNQAAFARMTADYYKQATEAREALMKQMLLGARLLAVMAAHLADLLAREAAAKAAAAPAPAAAVVALPLEADAAAKAATRDATATSMAACSSGDGGAGGHDGPTGMYFLTEELLPLLEPPTQAAGLELLVAGRPSRGGIPAAGSAGGSRAAAAPSARGPRLVALARRLLLAAASAWLSFEIQEKLSAQQAGGGGAGSAVGGATAAATKPQPRGGWPSEALKLFRAACGALAPVVAPDFLAPQLSAQERQAKAAAAASDLTLSSLAERMRLLAAAACAPDGGIRQVDIKSNRDFEGFGDPKLKGPMAALARAAQAKPLMPEIKDWHALAAGAARAVDVVAANDYRPTQDELVRRSQAATTIQRAWTRWRQRRDAAAAAAAQAQREREAVQRLRELSSSCLGLRIALRICKKRAARSIMARKQREEALTAGQDDFGLAAVEEQLKAQFLDQFSCPVCTSRQADPQPAEAATSQAGPEAELASPASPGSAARSLNAGVADFKPHKVTGAHVDQAESFRSCHTWFRTSVAPLLQFASQLLQALQRVSGEVGRPRGTASSPDDLETKYAVMVMENEMGLEGSLLALRRECSRLVEQRAWDDIPQVLQAPEGPMAACSAACHSAQYVVWEFTEARRAAEAAQAAEPVAEQPAQQNPPAAGPTTQQQQQQRPAPPLQPPLPSQQLQQKAAAAIAAAGAHAHAQSVLGDGGAAAAGPHSQWQPNQAAGAQQHAAQHHPQYPILGYGTQPVYAVQHQHVQQQYMQRQQALAQQHQQQQLQQQQQLFAALHVQQQLQQQQQQQQQQLLLQGGGMPAMAGYAAAATGQMPVWVNFTAPPQLQHAAAGAFSQGPAYAGAAAQAPMDLPPGLNINLSGEGGVGGPWQGGARPPPVARSLFGGAGIGAGGGQQAPAGGLRLDVESELAAALGGGGDGFQGDMDPLGYGEGLHGDGLDDEEGWLSRRSNRRSRYKNGGGGGGGRAGGGQGGYHGTPERGQGGAAGGGAARGAANPALAGNAFAPLVGAGATPPKQGGGKRRGGRK